VFDDLRRRHVDLAQPRLGAEVVYATDDFFGDKARLISPAEPVFVPGKYDDHGKWMDGWESRRRRTPGHDWCVVRLGAPGCVAGVEIDTRHFTGNYPPGAMVAVANLDADVDWAADESVWTEVTPRLELKGNDRAYFPIAREQPVTHVRLNIYPDGGVARLRVWGKVAKDWSKVDPDAVVDLLAMQNGGRGVIANDEHFGRVENLTAPGRGADMGDGWETRRRREPGHDWAVLELGAFGRIEEVVVDTAHFKGNYPDRCFLQATARAHGSPEEIAAQSESWPVLLPETKLEADQAHSFRELALSGPARFVRLNIIPDGGVSRLRLMGRVLR
jgi:allantoicase